MQNSVQNNRFSVWLILGFLAIWGLSACQFPVTATGPASLQLAVAGVLPPTRLMAAGQAVSTEQSRAVIPLPGARLYIRITGGNLNIEQTIAIPAAGTATVSIAALPVNVSLQVVVQALAADSSLVSSWEGGIILSAGSNNLAAVLAPPVAAVEEKVISGIDPVLDLAVQSLPYGSGKFYSLRFENEELLEWQIIAETGQARWLWLEVYDADWKRLPAIAKDNGQGWVVVSGGANKIVNVALANALATPGYPAAAIQYALQARRAYFAAADGEGEIYTSSQPSFFEGSVEIGGISIFMRAGEHLISNTINIRNDVHVYGGFSAASWADRNPRTYPTTITASALTPIVRFGDTVAGGRLDGLTIRASSIETGNQSPVAVSVDGLNGASGLVLNDLVLEGAGSGSTGGAMTSSALRIAAPSGLVELANSWLRGMASGVSSSLSAESRAITMDLGRAYIHNNSIDGGYVEAAGASAQVYGVYINGIDATSVVLVANRIWGGVVSAGSSGSRTVGVYVYGPVPASMPLLVANNAISGGYSLRVGDGLTTGVLVANNSLGSRVSVFGNTIDGGSLAASDTTGRMISLATEYSAASREAIANVLFGSAGQASAAARLALSETLGEGWIFQSRIGNSVLGIELPYADYSGADPGDWPEDSATSFDNQLISGSNPEEVFQAYTDQVFTATTWFGSNVALKPAALIGDRVSVGTVLADYPIWLAEFPALGLDLAGKARPANGLWTRGAVEQ